MRRKLVRAFDPPAPVVPVVLRAPDGSDSIGVDGKVDTGAGVCCVPEHVVADLDLPPSRMVRAAGFAGERREAIVYRVDIEIGRVVYRRVEALATLRQYAIVGRNLVRSLVLRVHGPREEVTLTLPRPRG